MFEVKEISVRNEWNNFLFDQEISTFLESWNWGEFNRSTGSKIWRLGIYQDSRLIGIALIIKITAKRGTFLFCPHGPILLDKKRGLKSLLGYSRQLAKKEKCSFVRFSPILKKTPENEKLFKDLGFRRAPMHMHAELFWMLDVSSSEEELLRKMRKTTRYLIRRAGKEEIEISKGCQSEDLENFIKLYDETARRQNFVAFSRNYLEKELKAFKEDNQALVFLAKYRGKFISGAVIVFCGQSAFYHQGASLLKYPKVPAPYLLQWEIIKEAKKRNLRYYNFWGVSPENKPKHPWAGPSLFKKGFGGFSEECLPAQDLILRPVYWFNYVIERIRKVRRKL